MVSVNKNSGGGVNITNLVLPESSGGVDAATVATKASMSAVCVNAGYTNAYLTEDDEYARFFNMASTGSGVTKNCILLKCTGHNLEVRHLTYEGIGNCLEDEE